MKNTGRLILFCACFLGFQAAHAQDSLIGYGLILGEPTGISAKGWLNGSLAVSAALAWSVVEQDRFQVQSDLLWHNLRLMTFAGTPFPLFAGVGTLVRFGDSYHFGIRVPAGGIFLIKPLGLDISVEVAPKYEILQNRGFGLDAGMSVRYYPLRL